MKDYCFFTYFSPQYEGMKNGLVNSVTKFYPTIPYVYLKTEGVNIFSDSVYNFIIELHYEYKRVIFINADSVMCAPCPHLFDDYEYGMPQNNQGVWKSNLYCNNGLQVTTRKEIWEQQKEWMHATSAAKDQDNCNRIFWESGFKNQLLEYKNECYGLHEYARYSEAYLKDKDIYIGDKKVCIFHFACGWHDEGKLRLERLNKDVAQRIKELTNDRTPN